MKTTILALVSLLLLSVSLSAQRSHFHSLRWTEQNVAQPPTIDCIMLGDTISVPDPTCEGCDAAKPDMWQDGGWVEIPVNANPAFSTYPTNLPAEPVAAWDVSDGGDNGFGLVLEGLRFHRSPGRCIWDDPTEVCTNGPGCFYWVYMDWVMTSKDSTISPPLTIELPGGGTTTITPSGSPSGPDAEGFYSWSWTSYNIHTIYPGCGNTYEWELDPDKMDPETGEYDVQGTNWPADPIKIKFECEVCPEDPVYHP